MSDIQAETDLTFVRRELAQEMPPPGRTIGPIDWVRANLLSSWSNVLLTLVGLYIIWIIVPPVLDFLIFDAVWEGEDRQACLGEEVGACWAFVEARFGQFIYGTYPISQRWRPNLFFFFGAALLVPLAIPRVPYKGLNALVLFAIYPVVSFILLTGGHLDVPGAVVAALWLVALAGAGIFLLLAFRSGGLVRERIGPTLFVLGLIMYVPLVVTAVAVDWGLRPVPTGYWGGLLVTLVVSATGITFSLPFGILLALGRRSKLPLVRLFSIAFIELWRGVPLVTVLFMASVMLPLFMPAGVTLDRLLRALIGVALFSSAYMAEVVRGGLQAIPRGQYEGAQAIGLGYWQMMGLIVMPQALKLVIPGIVNTFIGLFKDTTLVYIVGLFDLLGAVQASFSDPNWSTPVTTYTGYAFAAFIFFIFCFGMSRYSMFLEARLNTGHKR
jgi:general L-amino acid transport system permease protein